MKNQPIEVYEIIAEIENAVCSIDSIKDKIDDIYEQCALNIKELVALRDRVHNSRVIDSNNE